MAGRRREALATIESLRALPATTGADDPRIDVAEARVAQLLSEFKREREAAQRAITKAEARRFYEQSLALHTETGNELAVAWGLHSLANVVGEQDDLPCGGCATTSRAC